MRLGLIDRIRNLRPAHALGRIEHAELKPSQHQPAQGCIDLCLADQALAHRRQQRVVGLAAVELAASLDAERGRFGCGAHDLVMLEDVFDRVAVRNHVALESPSIAQRLLQQQRAGRRRLAIHAVVGAHDCGDLALLHQRLERGQVGVVEILLARMHIEVMSIGFGPAMHREVLRRRVHLAVLRIVALQTAHERDAHACGQPGIFAIRFLTAPPARVAKDVDVRRPERESLISPTQSTSRELMMLRACLIADRDRHLLHQISIERCGQPDGLRKHCRSTRAGHAVQRFVPPFVLRYSEPCDRRRVVAELRDLLVERHASDQVGGPRLEAATEIAIDRLLARVRTDRCADEATGHVRTQNRAVIAVHQLSPAAARFLVRE